MAALLGISIGACSGDDSQGPGAGIDASGGNGGSGAANGSGGSGADGSGASGNGTSGGTGGVLIGDAGTTGGAGGGSGGSDDHCESTERSAELAPIYLAFAFDVSGSMGHMDCPFWNHDATVKWEPVAEAVKGFFEDETSVNINASMRLFPSAEDHCEESSYETPDVEMQALPSTDFAQVLDAYEDEVEWTGSYTFPVPDTGGAGPWRGGTPTRQVVDATIAALQTLQSQQSDAKVALVLVTDGLPQSCPDTDVPAVVASVTAAAEEGIVTYVIGVKDPETPPAEPPWAGGWACNDDDDAVPHQPNPDTLDNLHQIADAGGTKEAILIDTGNPAATKDALRMAIDRIRSEAISCDLERPPPPPGQTFDPDRVNVRYDSGDESVPLGFDSECSSDNAWRYKGGETSVIELCPSTCESIQADPYASVQVEFGCVRRNVIH